MKIGAWFQKSFSCAGAALFIVASLFLGAATVQAQSALEEKLTVLIGQEIQTKYASDEQLNAALTRAYGEKLSAEKEGVARESFTKVIRHEAMPALLAEFFVPVVKQAGTQQGRAVVYENSLALAQKAGLRRVPRYQPILVTYLLAMMRAEHPANCKALVMGKLSPSEEGVMQKRYLASLSLADFSAATSLYHAAMLAELNRSPSVPQFSTEQIRIAKEEYHQAVRKRLNERVSLTAYQLVSTDIDAAPAKDVCQVSTESIAAMLDMPEPYKSWQLARFYGGNR